MQLDNSNKINILSYFNRYMQAILIKLPAYGARIYEINKKGGK